MKPISTLWPPFDWLWEMKLDLVINAPERSGLALSAPSSSNSHSDDLMIHSFQGAFDGVHILLFVSQCVSVSEP